MRLLCLIFFSFLNISFPQEISSLYKDYLSPEIKNNKIYLSQISSGFDELIKINPELIYYSIKYFNAMADTTSDRFFLTNFIKIRNMYQAGYIKWIRDVEDRIEQGESNSELKRISVNFLDDCLYNAKNDSVPGLSYKTDFNFMNFLIVKYYLQDTALRYNCSEDYKLYRERLEGKKADSYSAIFKKPAAFDKSDLDDIIAHWYIFRRFG